MNYDPIFYYDENTRKKTQRILNYCGKLSPKNKFNKLNRDW